MFAKLPDYADLYSLCDKGSMFSGRVECSDLSRLAPLLHDAQGEAEYKLTFRRDNEGRCVIENVVKADLNLVCQRCLGALPYQVNSVTQISPVTGAQEARQLPDHYEPLLITEPRLRLADLIEDELILAVPDVPRHSEADCAVNLADLNQGAVSDSAAQSEEKSPFAVLAGLKQQ